MKSRLPRSRRHLQRGCAACLRLLLRPISSRFSATRSSPWSRRSGTDAPTARWRRSRTRSKGSVRMHARHAWPPRPARSRSPASTCTSIRSALIARRAHTTRCDHRSRLPPPAARPVRPLHPGSAARRRSPGGRQHQRRSAGGRWRRARTGRARTSHRQPSIYGCVVIREGIEDEPGNSTRFLWLAPADGVDSAGVRETGAMLGTARSWKTTVVFSGLGNDHPGALVEALLEFSTRGDQPRPDRVPTGTA